MTRQVPVTELTIQKNTMFGIKGEKDTPKINRLCVNLNVIRPFQ